MSTNPSASLKIEDEGDGSADCWKAQRFTVRPATIVEDTPEKQASDRDNERQNDGVELSNLSSPILAATGDKTSVRRVIYQPRGVLMNSFTQWMASDQNTELETWDPTTVGDIQASSISSGYNPTFTDDLHAPMRSESIFDDVCWDRSVYDEPENALVCDSLFESCYKETFG